eukprot:scaffold207977_cov55-Attheya_sp.AAC.3
MELRNFEKGVQEIASLYETIRRSKIFSLEPVSNRLSGSNLISLLDLAPGRIPELEKSHAYALEAAEIAEEKKADAAAAAEEAKKSKAVPDDRKSEGAEEEESFMTQMEHGGMTRNDHGSNDKSTEKVPQPPPEPIPSGSELFTQSLQAATNPSKQQEKEYTMPDILSTLESLNARIVSMKPKADKFQKRLKEKDPITGIPRYNMKSSSRVNAALGLYTILLDAFKPIFEKADGAVSIADIMKQLIKDEDEARKLAERTSAAWKEKEAEQNRRRQEEEAHERARQEEEARLTQKRMEAELALRAEEARKTRLEEERRVIEDAAAAERAWVQSIEKGPNGVRAQLDVLRDACTSSNDMAGHSTAIGALYTIFSQITAHPEEVKFRRVRRDHARFHEDIGRHPGGREILIAAGFRCETLDGVPSFYSKEPHIETDMGGWKSWFDLLKATLEILEEELMK